jgi:hypothetical protein
MPQQVTIENPVLNSPYEEPTRHFRFTDDGIWVPAVNNHGGFGRWAFLEISDKWDTENTIRAMLDGKDSGESAEPHVNIPSYSSERRSK